MKFVPLTGLPRSGSTLLMSILAQNSLFHVFPDSPLPDVIVKTKDFIVNQTYNQQIPYQTFNNSMLDFCRGGTNSFINSLVPLNKILLDKSRTWIQNIDYVSQVFPDVKIICIVRDLRGMVNSFEKIHNYSLSFNRNDFNYNMNESFAIQRVQHILNLWFVKEVLISLKEIIELPRNYKQNIFFVKYEELIADPHETLRQVYDFLEFENFNHDFENIVSFPCNDNVFQPYGCHKVKSKIENLKDIYGELNQECLNHIVNEYFWYYKEFYPETL